MATKITIEIDGAERPMIWPAGTKGQSAGGSMMSHTAMPGGTMAASAGLDDVFVEAAATGAINAGPAPSLSDSSSPAPIAASVGGQVAGAIDSASAGTAPQDVFAGAGRNLGTSRA